MEIAPNFVFKSQFSKCSILEQLNLKQAQHDLEILVRQIENRSPKWVVLFLGAVSLVGFIAIEDAYVKHQVAFATPPGGQVRLSSSNASNLIGSGGCGAGTGN